VSDERFRLRPGEEAKIHLVLPDGFAKRQDAMVRAFEANYGRSKTAQSFDHTERRLALLAEGLRPVKRNVKPSTLTKLGVPVRVEPTRQNLAGETLDEAWILRWADAVLQASLPRRKRDRLLKRLVREEALREALLAVDDAPSEVRPSGSGYLDNLRRASEHPRRIRSFLESIS
jgi:hypothetical protein